MDQTTKRSGSRKQAKLLFIAAFVIVTVFILASSFFKNKEASELPTVNRIPVEKLVKPHNATLGNPDAKVVVVEFLDPECETCAALYPQVKGLMNDYKDRVKFVVRYMLYHGNSRLAALATEAAGKQGKYWEMQGQLFYRKDWTHQEDPQQEKFEDIAKNLELDVKKFKADMQDASIATNVDADYAEGNIIGVTGTPTFFVNGRQLSELSYEALKGLIEEELKQNP